MEFTRNSYNDTMLQDTLLVLLLIILDSFWFVSGTSYFYNLVSEISNDSDCDSFVSYVNKPPNFSYRDKMAQFSTWQNKVYGGSSKQPVIMTSVRDNDYPTTREKDPMNELGAIINRVLFGEILEEDADNLRESNKTETKLDTLAHFPSGQVMRAELFQNKSGVHLPIAQFMHRGHSYLQITRDRMQTAVNAFSIFLEGTVEDVLRLPPQYVLQSARTISMMKIAREKQVATWTVIKGNLRTNEITHQTLEMYRPLFKYINGREIAKLNLSDERILSYIGTHADLDRHQVGVVASKYIKTNKRWNDAKYLNLMNNLICGVPLLFMRMLSENTYLQLSHQLFYHIRSCDPLQRRFYLHLMTRTQVLGKSNSWSASDVARLGLLLTEVDAPELSAINPKAMSGMTAQVMLEMPPQKLKHLTETQLKYIAHKPMNILAKKMHRYQDELQILNSEIRFTFHWIHLILALQLSC